MVPAKQLTGRYPLPLIRETLRLIAREKWISKVDVRAAFHRLRIKEGDEWKTAFRTRFGSFEWLVTPFGLAGAPAASQRWINNVLGDLLGDTCAAYLNEVVMFPRGNLEDHWEKVSRVLYLLAEAGLRFDPQKCDFAKKKTRYLGYVVEAEKGIKVDDAKIKAIIEWDRPRDIKGVREFLGFANFYRNFINNFATLASPLQKLTNKGTLFVWTDDHQKAFDNPKKILTTAPVLAMWHEDKMSVLETDASGWATGGCLSQFDPDGTLYPVAYYSKKLTPTECNYDIHDKELLSIIWCLNCHGLTIVGNEQ
ncbi:hypothetical protein K3495_g6193 [Podosphaera aphanis]|nr:hypothetical protein K3495_g6193 [Podosphaera aphanis]